VSPGAIGAQFHCGWSGSFYTDGERQAVLDKLKAAGISWVRIDVAWSGVESSGKGARSAGYLQTIDRCVDLSRERGLNVLIMFWHTPSWANGGRGAHAPPTNVGDYEDMAKWMAARYKGRVQAWQIWNEPNSTTFWTGTTTEYVNLLKAGYRGFKAGDAGGTVVLGGPSFNDDAWIRDVYSRGAKDSFDVVSTHPYQGFGDAAPESADDGNKWWFTHTPAVRKVMTDYGDADAQIWFTEFGWSAHDNATIPSDHNWARGVTEAVQADYAVRAIQYARKNWPYVGPMFWYKERSWTPASSGWFDLHLEGYGLLRADRSERPVYGSLRKLLTGS
jgi:arabinogalactan endo-1,4-beta-galactosidase